MTLANPNSHPAYYYKRGGDQPYTQTVPYFLPGPTFVLLHSLSLPFISFLTKRWWIARLQSAGFLFDKGLSAQVRSEAFNEWSNFRRNVEPGNETNMGQHIRGMMVFHNPVVSSLQQHAHLFAG